MLFEDLFYEDEVTAPAPHQTARLLEHGRTVQMRAEYLESGEVIKWSRTPEIRRTGGTAPLQEAASTLRAAV
jgi:hypothetical protein